MKDLKSKLKQTPKKTDPKPAGTGEAAMTLQVNPPVVRVAPPNVTVEVKDVKLDAVALTKALADLGNQVRAMSDQVTRLVEANQRTVNELLAKQTELLEKLAEQKPAIKLPARPAEFYVTLDRENGEAVGMRVSTSKH